ncbi:hypothetical protein BDZ85DRAFT_241820 [Elsinoe ampelina]|uniref:Putative lipoate-protein ligase A n=1 Tax=Elsinoe ampelina TaxID=302913 RepID=A0A6A6G3N5_9PEZI|nr:hypothetical protein BDZ85DRAFT_241820 [Elsinoe ampelina]
MLILTPPARRLPSLPPVFSLSHQIKRYRTSHSRFSPASSPPLCFAPLSHSLLDRPVQSYISRSSDPYLNLSIEHHLLQKTAPESAVLFLYVNRPCVVVGRNQNPWTEVNLALLKDFRAEGAIGDGDGDGRGERIGLDLVRRRSGGGTVFHDFGNVNWTVISPSAKFTRDKHAEMVVRALRRVGVERARVNERHDIVVDLGERKTGWMNDTHSTPWMGGETRKVGGSAYKLTRGRALHHGTALLGSGNLGRIKEVLTAPGKGLIESKGVESVSSPVANVGIGNKQFMREVGGEFGKLYGQVETKEVGEEWLEDQGLRKGWEELKSLDWTYCQTPRFKISNESVRSANTRLPLLTMEAKGGCVENLHIKHREDAEGFALDLKDESSKHKIHEIQDWGRMLSMWEEASGKGLQHDHRSELGSWIESMLPARL